ncbi:MAG: S8 family serine peptidase [Desulfurococcales archaeon]|jgi:subtilisin family serine protease/prefoldin subunit 5
MNIWQHIQSLIAVLLILACIVGAFTASSYPQFNSVMINSKVDPEVFKELSKSGSARVLILLNDTPYDDIVIDKLEGANFVRALMINAERSQNTIVDRLRSSGVRIVDRLWLVNAIVADVDSRSLSTIINIPSIFKIVPDRVIGLVKPVEEIYLSSRGEVLRPLDNISRSIVQADKIEAMGITGRGVKVAILDTGIQVDHPWLIRNGTSVVVAEYDATRTGVVHVCVYRNETASHGTHVAGIIASQDPVHRGVAPGVDIYNVIVFSPLLQCKGAAVSWIIRGIQWSLLGPDGRPGTGDEAQIISMSLGTLIPPWFSYYYKSYDPLLTAISRAVEAGAVVVIAAGNGGPGGYTINYLCLARGVICVGAADTTRGSLSSSSIAIFSSRGPIPFDIPMPDVSAPGVRIISSVPINSTAAFSGTSMATPHVSGVAALLKQAHPEWSPIDIKRAIVESASPIPLSDIYETPNPLEQGTGMVRALDALNNPLRMIFTGGALQGLTQTLIVPPGDNALASLAIYNVGNYTLGVDISSTDLVSYLGTNVIRKTALTISPPSVSIGPGGSASVTITVSVPSRTPPGTYVGYIIATAGSYSTRLPISIVVPASLVESNISYSLAISTYIGAGPPEWVTYRLYISQPIGELATITSYSEYPLPLSLYMLTPSNRFIASISGLRFPERGEYILIIEVPGDFALFGKAEISIVALKISRGLSQIANISRDLASLRSDLESMNISTHQRISSIELDISSISTAIDMLRGVFGALNTSLEITTQQIAIIRGNVTELAQKISENTVSIASVRSSLQDFISTAERRFSGLEGTLLTAINNITSLRNNLERFQQSTQQSIADIQNTITSLTRDLNATNLYTRIALALGVIGIAIGATSIALARRKK